MNFISSSRKFEFVGTIDTQMKSFAELRSTNPDKAKAIFENGMKLVEHAKAGEFRKFRMIVDNGEEGDFLVYFVSQMMLASLVSGHLMITQYIIDQGYPINNYHIPSSLHQCLELTEDANGVAVVEFLSAKKIDVNRQEQQSWLTPLHIAVSRALVQTVRALIHHGADVNAVAKDDVMPLNIALKLEDGMDRKRIVALLRENDARDTWRTGKIATQSCSGVPIMETKHVTFSGGGKVKMSGQHFAPSETPQLVTLKGGGSSSPNDTEKTGGCSSTLMTMTGGGGSSSMIAMKGGHRVMTQRNSLSTNMVTIKGGNGSLSDESITCSEGELSHDLVNEVQNRSTVDQDSKLTGDSTFSFSDDGGMLFSTS